LSSRTFSGHRGRRSDTEGPCSLKEGLFQQKVIPGRCVRGKRKFVFAKSSSRGSLVASGGVKGSVNRIKRGVIKIPLGRKRVSSEGESGWEYKRRSVLFPETLQTSEGKL